MAGLGCLAAVLKSLMERVQPRPNMITKVIKMSRFVSVGVSMVGNANKKRYPGQKIMRDKQLGDYWSV